MASTNPPQIIEDEEGNIIAIVDSNHLGLEDNEVIIDVIFPDNDNLNSYVVDIKLVDPFGNSIQPTGPVELCFQPNSTSKGRKQQCLGYLEEGTGDWVCESCLEEKNGLLCGKSSHFTMFSLLLDVGGAGVDDLCGPGTEYMTGSFTGDALLVSMTIVGVCGCLLLFTFFASLFPQLHGQEYTRLSRVRSHTNTVITLSRREPVY